MQHLLVVVLIGLVLVPTEVTAFSSTGRAFPKVECSGNVPLFAERSCITNPPLLPERNNVRLFAKTVVPSNKQRRKKVNLFASSSSDSQQHKANPFSTSSAVRNYFSSLKKSLQGRSKVRLSAEATSHAPSIPPPSHSQNVSATTNTSTTTTTTPAPSKSILKDCLRPHDRARPLHQNWWPVSLESALDPNKPNAIDLLGMQLVLIPKGADGEWACLEDRCSHRFAPLSEGRLIKNQKGEGCVQCAYHGWEFDGSGACTRVPQNETGSPGKAVHSYPVQSKAGMIWVWSDWASLSMSEQVSVPISPLMERYYELHGSSAGFMRDLPYGMEILGENLLDLSHLPYSHHSVGGLQRDLGGPVPLRMISESERKKLNYSSSGGGEPFFEAEVVNASQHDPVFRSMAKRMDVPANATCNIGFFHPSHVRYHRRVGRNGMAFDVQLFMCPTKAGKSRVILYNIFEQTLPPVNATKPSLAKRLSPNAVASRAKQALLRRATNPASVTGHMISHSIFDGDGIFLHKQGDRMKRAGLTYRDYDTPSSADVLLNAFRRWLDSSALKAMQLGAAWAKDCVDTPESYKDNVPRAELLDRYNSHTAHCKVCSAALKKCRRRRDRFKVASIAMTGAAGSWLTALAALGVVTLFGKTPIAPLIVRTVALTAVSTVLASFLSAKASQKADLESKKFIFEDYVHATKA